MIDKARLLCIHQSDPNCLARFHAERVEGVDSTNEAALVGSACHRATEALAYVAEDDDKTPEALFAIARQAIETATLELGMSPAATEKALEIMERALATDSRLRFGRTSGWESAAEVRWALDRNFRPCDPNDPKRIAAGTIDLIEWQEAEGTVRVTDDKTTLGFQGHDDIFHGWQPRLYSLWAIQNYGVRSVVFRYRNLRHGYAVAEEFHASGSWVGATKERVLALRAEREAAVEMDVWPETMGPDCDYCPVLHRCGAIRAAAKAGRIIDPELTPADRARRLLGLRAAVTAYEKSVRAEIAKTAEPIDLGAGLAFGLCPASGSRLRARYAADDGTISPEQREKLMAFLRGYKMTPEQEAEWFLFKRTSDMPGAVKNAIHELLGKEAGKFLDDDTVSPLEPVTDFEFRPWLPETSKRAVGKALDAVLDDSRW